MKRKQLEKHRLRMSQERSKRVANCLEDIHKAIKRFGWTHDYILDLLADSMVTAGELDEYNKQLRTLVEDQLRLINIFGGKFNNENDKDGLLRIALLNMFSEGSDDSIAKVLLNGIGIQNKDRAKRTGKAGAKKRHAPQKLLEEWTIEQYQQQFTTKQWRSANKAAHDLELSVIAHGRDIGARLSEENAQRTIAGWIRKFKKSV